MSPCPAGSFRVSWMSSCIQMNKAPMLRVKKRQKENYKLIMKMQKRNCLRLGNKEKTEKKNKQGRQTQRKPIEKRMWKKRNGSTKPFDELNEQEAELQRENDEAQAIIQDKNTSPSDKQAAEDRLADRNEELERLQMQIEKKRKSFHFLSRSKWSDKFGVTVTAVFLTTVVTIGAVIGAIKTLWQPPAKRWEMVWKMSAQRLHQFCPGWLPRLWASVLKLRAKPSFFWPR